MAEVSFDWPLTCYKYYKSYERKRKPDTLRLVRVRMLKAFDSFARLQPPGC